MKTNIITACVLFGVTGLAGLAHVASALSYDDLDQAQQDRPMVAAKTELFRQKVKAALSRW